MRTSKLLQPKFSDLIGLWWLPISYSINKFLTDLPLFLSFTEWSKCFPKTFFSLYHEATHLLAFLFPDSVPCQITSEYLKYSISPECIYSPLVFPNLFCNSRHSLFQFCTTIFHCLYLIIVFPPDLNIYSPFPTDNLKKKKIWRLIRK